GRALCDVFKRDYRVFGLDLENCNKLKNFCLCDITKFNQVKKTILAAAPDIVIHTAAYPDVDGCEKNREIAKVVNTQGAVNIAKVSQEIDAALFFISTDYVFDGKKESSYRESDRPSPLNAYGRQKLEAEEFIRRNLSKYFIIRTSWLYGKGGRNFVDTIINSANANSELKVVDDQIGGPTYVVDLAGALKALVNKIKTAPKKYAGIYNITNSGKCSWYEFAKTILKIKNIEIRITPLKSFRLTRPAKRPENSLLNNSKFNRLTHKPMRRWKKALCAYLES
ncbi:MAG: dTDP-4-dehydrorhamnose reductase, partial [Candidatus Omnitrophota bacterium]